jgi:hypothetical protein
VTHGTLKNKQTGQEVTGKLLDEDWSDYLFRIDGTGSSNSFDSADWEFTADTPPPPAYALPTEHGVYAPLTAYSSARPGEPVPIYLRIFKLDNGTWSEVSGNDHWADGAWSTSCSA